VSVLTCDEARTLEHGLFAGDEAREWQAMARAGTAVGEAIARDFGEKGHFPAAAKILTLVGKGHNGGDALLATKRLLERFEDATADIVFCFGEKPLRPLTVRAWREVQQTHRSRVVMRAASDIVASDASRAPGYAVCVDGVFGFQYRPPLSGAIEAVLNWVNALSIGFRAAVDLPSADRFRADFTYATGSVKAPVLASENAGRIRYLDLGFFRDATNDRRASAPSAANEDRVLTTEILEPLAALRPARSDKRTFGHVFILGGSVGFPGAVLMCATAAVRSGAGLVTVFAPQSLVPAFAARLPEAIWVGWPESPGGGLALEGEHLLRERLERADALVLGPGAGREAETLALFHGVVERSRIPLVIDADALQPNIVSAGDAPRVLTPHAGEFKRIAAGRDLRAFAQDPKLTVVLKGPITRICAGGPVFHALWGGPVLARGGSGDLLAGMIGCQVAQLPERPAEAAARAVAWHGLAADDLARACGQTAVATTQLVEFLGGVLRTLG